MDPEQSGEGFIPSSTELLLSSPYFSQGQERIAEQIRLGATRFASRRLLQRLLACAGPHDVVLRLERGKRGFSRVRYAVEKEFDPGGSMLERTHLLSPEHSDEVSHGLYPEELCAIVSVLFSLELRELLEQLGESEGNGDIDVVQVQDAIADLQVYYRIALGQIEEGNYPPMQQLPEQVDA